MTTNQDPFSRSDLHLELRRKLLAAERGVLDAEILQSRMPLLSDHPAVLSRMPDTGGRRFQRALESVLGLAIARSEETEPMKRALRWHFALDHGDTIERPEARKKAAAKLAGSNPNRYAKDRAGEKPSELTVALDSIEHHLRLLGQETRERPSIKVGVVVIPDVFIVAACQQGEDMTGTMTVEFEKTLRDDRPDCAEWPLLRDLLVELKDEAKVDGRTFRDNDALDLVCAEELNPVQGAPRRYRLGVAKTTYNRWVATANSLDRDLSGHRELTERLGSDSLRQAWGHAPECLEDLAELPAPCYVGVCVVVVVEDQMVVLARQRKHMVAGAEPSSAERARQPVPAHFVGEGTEPQDLIAGASPADQAALRGCYEELGLNAEDVELIPTAFVFDTLRWQPLFCYVARCKLALHELEARIQKADSYEETSGRIAALRPLTIADPETRGLLVGSDPSMRLASNHAQAALLYALVYADGLEQVHSAAS